MLRFACANSARNLYSSFPHRVTLGLPARLQAPSQRFAFATNSRGEGSSPLAEKRKDTPLRRVSFLFMVGVAGQRQNKGRLCFDLLAQTQHATFILPFRIESRSAYLLGCKRPRNGSLSLPTLAVRVQVPQRKKRKDTPLRRVSFLFMVGVAGLEPAASWSRKCSKA